MVYASHWDVQGLTSKVDWDVVGVSRWTISELTSEAAVCDVVGVSGWNVHGITCEFVCDIVGVPC